ncbi:MAG TPA: Gfo/Idh/MocA family oxidoreductase [Verrucomicrobiota bacterium]|nr:Gfo/Idh/MocA family oxidoreductase [Verrucomicrobiota bacterium]HRZ38208.1 Gfo/Idh/MocA family oxidoreductase [Candidatus Paceibacterota bacterium]HRZ54177.1 Gfo/Idh/MocA family oxidoreductase [Candidatus Paceibacterota bacterium]
MKTIRFGLIGCGLMGREFASATARWCHLLDADARPELVAVCNRGAAAFEWFRRHFPGIAQYTHDYRDLLANPAVDAVYVAVPHHLHREVYCAAAEAGKHLMGEKPFGIDSTANTAILDALERHPDVFARCASQWVFFPGAQRIGDLIERGAFGQILEVNTGFLHSGDLDPNRPINWKRRIEHNGEYGCMGDLGLHVCCLPFRAGWTPRNVRAVLSNIVRERPDGRGGMAPCRTWDNATLLCETTDSATSSLFPWTVKTQRIAPGHKNTWYIEVYGTKASARFSTLDPKRLDLLEYAGGEQVWGAVQTGHETAFPTITGPNFEFGSPDAILQMWAAFLHELVHRAPLRTFAGCATPADAALSHRLFTAALRSHARGSVEPVEPPVG